MLVKIIVIMTIDIKNRWQWHQAPQFSSGCMRVLTRRIIIQICPFAGGPTPLFLSSDAPLRECMRKPSVVLRRYLSICSACCIYYHRTFLYVMLCIFVTYVLFQIYFLWRYCVTVTACKYATYFLISLTFISLPKSCRLDSVYQSLFLVNSRPSYFF